MRDPSIRQRQREGVKRRFADPDKRAAAIETALRNSRDMHKRSNRQQAGRTRSIEALASVPLDLRPVYVSARREFGAAHARKIIADHLAAEKRRARL